MQFGLFGGAHARPDGAIEIPIARLDGPPLHSVVLHRRWLTRERATAAGYRLGEWELAEQLRDAPASQREIETAGGRVLAPRLELFYGPAGSRYRYAGTDYPAEPVPSGIGHLMREAGTIAGTVFNAAFLNVYRDGSDSIGWHADDEPSLGAPGDVVIASLSLGASRPFQVRPWDPDARDPSPITTIELHSGDLLLMPRGLQAGYKHAVPKREAVRQVRYNLTFRRIFP